MIGVYFSGTGNSKFCADQFVAEHGCAGCSYSIEQGEALEQIKNHDEIAVAYPVQFSNAPKILRDYIVANRELWKGKKVFVIATMGLFSGDGAGILARLFEKYGAVITGGLHLRMPDSISDEKALKRGDEKNRTLVENARKKIHKAVGEMKNGKPPREGLGIGNRLAGLLGQRLYFFWKTARYTDKLKIDRGKCVGCGLCVKLCPMRNISLSDGAAAARDRCTMCYRCINKCPRQAITLLGKKVVEQGGIDRYL